MLTAKECIVARGDELIILGTQLKKVKVVARAAVDRRIEWRLNYFCKEITKIIDNIQEVGKRPTLNYKLYPRPS